MNYSSARQQKLAPLGPKIMNMKYISLELTKFINLQEMKETGFSASSDFGYFSVLFFPLN